MRPLKWGELLTIPHGSSSQDQERWKLWPQSRELLHMEQRKKYYDLNKQLRRSVFTLRNQFKKNSLVRYVQYV